jgi:hypothetical protein
MQFEERYAELLDKRKQFKLQRLQHRNEINRDDVNNVIREASRKFRNKEKEYQKGRINELQV